MEPWLASIITAYEPVVKSLFVLLFLIGELALAGCLVMALLPASCRYRLSLPELILPGLFVAVAFAESWSLFAGVTPWANLALVLILVILAVVRWRVFRSLLGDSVRSTRWGNLIFFLPCLVFAAMNALTNGFCYDTLLYHLAAIRWVADFGSVPGLANLHGRLGFNTALHPLAALFGFPFGIEVGREFVNPVIIVSAGAVLLQGIKLNRKEFFLPDSVYACLLFPLVLGLLFSDCLSSPQPDVSSAGIAILVAWYLRGVVQESAGDKQAVNYLGCFMGSSLVVTFKLSYAVLGLAAAGLATVILFRRRGWTTLILVGLIIAGVFSIPWLCRGYITSGYPLFPAELGRIHFDWVVPHEAALSERNWVLSWARAPDHNWRSVLVNSDWIRLWVATTVADPIVLKAVVLLSGGLMLIALTGPWRYRKDSVLAWCWLIGPIILSMLFWFFTAPNPRFAQATFWILAADVVYLPFVCLNRVPRFCCAFFLLLIAGFSVFELAEGFVRLHRERERFPNFVGGAPPLVSRVTFSGLAIWVPTEGNLTGPWQIPATPADRFDPRLELRGKTLREGFRIDRSRPKPPMW
ncbi:MAG TPA: hypothetical protein VIH58_09345 [Chthoniobacterales bacterium]